MSFFLRIWKKSHSITWLIDPRTNDYESITRENDFAEVSKNLVRSENNFIELSK